MIIIIGSKYCIVSRGGSRIFMGRGGGWGGVQKCATECASTNIASTNIASAKLEVPYTMGVQGPWKL